MKCCGITMHNTFNYCPKCGRRLGGVPGVKTYKVNDLTFREQRLGMVAVNTGVFRRPCKGEFYLSGAEPEAWKASNDLTSEFYIAEVLPACALTTRHLEVNRVRN